MVERTTVIRNGREYVAFDGLTRHDPGYEGTRRRWRDSNNLQDRKARDKKRRDRARQLILEAKCKPCVDCGQSHAPFVLDFHHARGKKLFSISVASNKIFPISAIKDEIAKCDLLCSNCHRYRTHNANN